ncbi:hypothetical protein OOJ91_12615 [Micromonospora lupini]|uniref:hypothetical protein n=1 Tax=Micromonospora lupini TaxID=285679 RepID=UPI00224C7C23|nr:hypothetical protein [Micromonospora lupini]MCX5066723.1 hypothetical protein [Micromonospora lupini]
MDSIAVIARRAARVEVRARRRPVIVEVTNADGEPIRRRQRPCRPSRQTSDRTAIAASQFGTA